MKRKVLVLCIILFSLLTFNGCIFDNTFKAEEEEVNTMTGILTVQSNSDDISGTYILTDEEGTKTPLRSLAINLSSSKYLDNKVQVMGFLNDEDGVFEVTGVSVIEILTEEDQEAKFVTYKNSDFGIELKYYNDWEVKETLEEVVFLSPAEEGEESDKIEITQSLFAYMPSVSEEGEADTALISYLSENYPEITDPRSLLVKIGVDQLDAIEFEGDNFDVEYYLYRSGLIYKIAFIGENISDDSNKKIFNEMMSEFKFIGFTVGDEILDSGYADEEDEEIEEIEEIDELPVVDMNFATFESSIYHFRANYPASWYYAGSKGTEPGVKHRYGFSDESVTEENEILSMDVISNDIPSGQSVNLENGKGVKVSESSGEISIYVSVDGQNFRVRGPKEYEDLMTVMASSITPVEEDEEA